MNQHRVMNLVGLVYDAASDPAAWGPFLEGLVDLTGGIGADLAAFDLVTSRASVRVGTGSMNADFRREYAGVAHLDPFIIRARERRLFRDGLVGVGEDLVPQRELERTEFYSAFGRRHAYVGGLVAIIAASTTSMAAIGISRRPDREVRPGHVALLRTLTPHLQRAWNIHVRLSGWEQERASFAEALNRLALAVLLVGEGGTIAFANDAALALLAQRDGLVIDRATLRGARPQDTTALNALIAGALATAASRDLHGGGALRLGRPSGRRPLRVIVSPLPANERLTIGEPRALVFVTDPEDRREPDATILRHAYGLTPAEVEVAGLLMQDKSVREMSEWLGVSVHTVRFHIKQLLAKTGASRQGALVRLLSAITQIRRP